MLLEFTTGPLYVFPREATGAYVFKDNRKECIVGNNSTVVIDKVDRLTAFSNSS